VRYDLIELCAGTAAVSLVAIGAPKFPVSRIGSKAGYVEPILSALGIRPRAARSVYAVELDDRLAHTLGGLLNRAIAEYIADEIASRSETSATWQQAKHALKTPTWEIADYLVWLAGARGGIGGFKGEHIRRPSVRGFIPSLASLAQRVRAFQNRRWPGHIAVTVADVTFLDATIYAPTAVYIDAPYLGRQGYDHALKEPTEEIAQRWARAGHRVVVSEARPLPGADRTVDITNLRRGQTRRSLTKDAAEWLSIYEAKR
jgi:hypothetical protein